MNKIRYRIVKFLVAALSISTLSAMANSVDDCMEAKKQTAINICQKVIDSGKRDVNVYYQLSSQLHQTGNSTVALEKLNGALRLFPSNGKLTQLKKLIETDFDESQRIALGNQKDQSTQTLYSLKASCLTNSSAIGLKACQQYVKTTNKQDARILARIELLGGSTTTTPKQPRQIPKQATTDTNKATPVPTRKKYTTDPVLAQNIQIALNSLGFNSGTPDGLPGGRTRKAATDFYASTGLPVRSTIDDQMLNDLIREKNKLSDATTLLDQSRRASSDQDPEGALVLLDKAEALSNLLKIPLGYRANLDIQLEKLKSPVVLAKGADTKTIIKEPDNTQTELVVQDTALQDNTNQQFEQLMTQVFTLEKKLDSQRIALQNRMSNIRLVARELHN